jgi:hypothetical protein
MIDRPDWNLPATAPSPEEVVAEIASGADGPSKATQQLVETDGAKAPSVPALSRDARGNVIRPDWGKPVVPVKRAGDWDFDNEGNERPRSEQGQYITKSESELRQTFAKEGGLEANVARIQEAESTMLSLSADPVALQTAINELPTAIQLKAADVLRLSTSYGQGGGALKVEQFLNSLSASEFESFKQWFNKLSRSDQDALIYGATR